MIKDGNGATYDATAAKFTTTPFGFTLPAGKTAASDLVVTPYFTPFDYTTTTAFAQKVDNSVAGEMRDCAECHVGGGMMEYIIDPSKTTTGDYDPSKRTSLRTYAFNGAVTAYNALIDIFNPVAANRGNVVVQNYAETGVLEMDCLICHQSGYDWSARKEAVREGHFDASRAIGAGLATRAVNGTTVFYNSTTMKVNASGEYVADLSASLNAKPQSNQCNSCHQGTADLKYQVEWKKRGEMWTYKDAAGNTVNPNVHASIGCLGCHERKDKSAATIGTDGLKTTKLLSLCDPAKGGASPFEAMSNQIDDVEFKTCAGCHESATNPTFMTYGAPASRTAHEKAGLTAKIAFSKTGASISHMDLIDCTSCHVKKEGFTGGAFVDGTGADEEGRVAIHDTEHVGKDMANGTALKWSNGKIFSANFLTSFFWRDMNGMKTANGGLDVNNDGREAGMDPILPTHVNNINIANGLHGLSHDGEITAAEITTQQGKLVAGLKAQLGLGDAVDIRPAVSGAPNLAATNPALLKLNLLMVPFKTSHNVGTADKAWGAKGCKECHSAPGATVTENGNTFVGGGFYNGAYPINGNMEGKFTFNSDQFTTYTKVNGLVDITDSHPNVVNKKGDRSLPIPVISKFDTPYTQTVTTGQYLVNIDRSHALYEKDFKTLDTQWYTGDATGSVAIQGAAISAVCAADGKSPFYCDKDIAAGGPLTNVNKRVATSTIGWTMKIEIDGTPATFRTKMVGDDKVTTVEELITALGTAYTDNADFKIEAVNATTGLPTVGGNNSLKITPKDGKKIRISSQSDVGPFGLAGKLWKADKITRNGVDYTTRDAYVAYLNTVADNKAALGIDVAPVASILTTGDAVAPGGTTPVAAVKGIAVPLYVAPVAGMTYSWRVNTSYATITNGTTATPSIVISKPGIWLVSLTVKNAEGVIATDSQRVSVVAPTLINEGLIATVGGVTTVPVTLDASVGTYTKAKFVWGDGSASTVIEGTNPALSPTHAYKRTAKYLVGGSYKYTTTVQIFNGAALVSTKSINVVLAP